MKILVHHSVPDGFLTQWPPHLADRVETVTSAPPGHPMVVTQNSLEDAGLQKQIRQSLRGSVSFHSRPRLVLCLQSRQSFGPTVTNLVMSYCLQQVVQFQGW